MAEISAFKYRVFLSYSHRDQAWGKWLQGTLEAYRIDHDLVGRETAAGAVPKRLRPIFRGREDFPGGDALTEQTLAALHASQSLIVICSPSAAKSRRVNEEIRYFKAIGRADRVIPLIVAGTPGDPERECIPPALRFRLAPDRRLADETSFADAQAGGDGKELAVHKLVAELLDLELDEVERHSRAARGQHRRRRRVAVVAAVLALALAYEGGLAWARHAFADNELLLDRTLVRVATIANKAVTVSRQIGLPRGLSMGLLREAEDLLRELAGMGRETPQLRFRKAAILIELARNYAALGNGELQRARATEADRLMQRLFAESPRDPAWQFDLSLTYDELGDVLHAQGRFQEALAAYGASRAIAERLAAASFAGLQRDLAAHYVKVGNVYLAQGALDEALGSYDVSLLIAVRHAAAEPGDVRGQHDLSVSHERIGEVLRLQGELEGALTSYRAMRAAAERLIAADPGNTDWQRGLAAAHVKVGELLALVDKPDEALASYRASNVIAERLAAADPGNLGWQKDLAVSHERIGSVLEAKGDFAAALQAYRVGLAIGTRLAAAEPDNAGWQRDLALTHEHIGDVLRATRDLAGALRAYQAKRAIIGRLAAADPGNVGWQYDLGIGHARAGAVLEDRGDFVAALKEYEACFGIIARFAAADPDNAMWRHDLAVSHDKLASAYHRLGKVAFALAELRKGHDIMAALVTAAPEVEQWSEEVARFDTRIAALEGRGKVAAKCEPPCGNEAAATVLFAGPRRDRIEALAALPPKSDN